MKWNHIYFVITKDWLFLNPSEKSKSLENSSKYRLQGSNTDTLGISRNGVLLFVLSYNAPPNDFDTQKVWEPLKYNIGQKKLKS